MEPSEEESEGEKTLIVRRDAPPSLDPVRDPEVHPAPPREQEKSGGEKNPRAPPHSLESVGDAEVHQVPRSYFKVILVGDTGVGKSSIISKFNEAYPCSKHRLTATGEAIRCYAATQNDKSTEIHIWDSACTGTNNSCYCRGADGAIIVYDVTDQRSFTNAEEWKKHIISCAGGDIKIILLGHKVDCVKIVDSDTAKVYANENDMTFMESSRTDSYTIPDAFVALLNKMIYRDWGSIYPELVFRFFTCAPSELNVMLKVCPQWTAAIYSRTEYRDWSDLPYNVLLKIFRAAPFEPIAARSTRARIPRVCSIWRKAIFSSPPWPVMICPRMYALEGRFDHFIGDDEQSNLFQILDPIRAVPPLQIAMHLIGGDCNSYLFVDTGRDALVLWSLSCVEGKPQLEPIQLLLSLPKEFISSHEIYIGSFGICEEESIRVLVVGRNILVAATFGQFGELLCPWAEVQEFQSLLGCGVKIKSLVFCNQIAYMLDQFGNLFSLSWENSSAHMREMCFCNENPFHQIPREGTQYISCSLIVLPAENLIGPQRLVCFGYQLVDRYEHAFFQAEEISVIEDGDLILTELENMGTCSIFTSKSAFPTVIPSSSNSGYENNSVYRFSDIPTRHSTNMLWSCHLLRQHVDEPSIEFGVHEWPFSFFVLPGWWKKTEEGIELPK